MIEFHLLCRTITITTLKRNLLAGIYTQHGRPKPVRQSSFGIRLSLLSHMGRRPLLLTVLIVLTVHVALRRQIVRGVNSLAVIRAVVRPATVSQVRRENKKLAYIPPFSNQVAAVAGFSQYICTHLPRARQEPTPASQPSPPRCSASCH